MKSAFLGFAIWSIALISQAVTLPGAALSVDVVKPADGKVTFNIINLKQFDDAASTAKWIYELQKKERGGDKVDQTLRYSNSVKLHFSNNFQQKEIAIICAQFEANQVYLISATREEDGRRVTVSNEADPGAFFQALIDSGQLTPGERKALRELLTDIRRAEQDGPEQPATAPKPESEGNKKSEPESTEHSQ